MRSMRKKKKLKSSFCASLIFPPFGSENYNSVDGLLINAKKKKKQLNHLEINKH